MKPIIQFMDTTLRDGEQTAGVAFSDAEKLTIAKILLQEVGVDRIEIASARVSDGEKQAARLICQWAASAGFLDKVEMLGFVDGGQSLRWIYETGGRVINLLAKGSIKHLQGQLGKSPDQHVEDIKVIVNEAKALGVAVHLYLEDWSNGMKDSRDYVYYLMDQLQDSGIIRFMLPDTLGVLAPRQTYTYCTEMLHRYPHLQFDFHAHNDYDLSTANVMEAAMAGIHCFHTTINGLGERAGNAALSSVLAGLKDHLGRETRVQEAAIFKVSKLVESFSGVRIPANKPVIGDHVFTQTCGVHADGDAKNDLYVNALLPERFGRNRNYALGKTSGKANIRMNLAALGIQIDEAAVQRVTQRVIELGDKKERITLEDLPYIVADVLDWDTAASAVKVENYNLTHAKGLMPVASLALRFDGELYEAHAAGDGQYDAFMNALGHIYAKLGLTLPTLTDYAVHIPPGGHTDAIVETTITWQGEREFKTRGIDTDQTFAAIKATEKMLNIIHIPGSQWLVNQQSQLKQKEIISTE